jgi:hypothetical protein
LPDPLNCARIRVFIKINTPLSAVKLLHYLNITTLTFAYNSAAEVLLYFFLKFIIIPTCATMMNIKKLDRVLSLLDLPITTENPCPSAKPCNLALHEALDSKVSPVAGKSKKPGGRAATARSNVARWCVGTRKRIAWSYPLFRRSIFAMDRRSLRKTNRHN